MNERLDILKRKSEIEEWCVQGLSKFEMADRLCCNIKTLRKYLDLLGIQYLGRQDWNKGRKFQRGADFTTYTLNGGVGRASIKTKLLRESLKEYRCECCGLDSWLNSPIPLELHHKDGNQTNVSLDNLQLLCPNCHTLTDNYRGRGVKLRLEQHYCLDCGKLISQKASRCSKCANRKTAHLKAHSEIRPTRDKLLYYLVTYTNFSKIGSLFKVSDNAVRKWCVYYNLPKTTKYWKTQTDFILDSFGNVIDKV